MNTNVTVKLLKNHLSSKNTPALIEATEPEYLTTLPVSLWQSPGGSLYKYMNGEFVCVCVHSSRFQGWLNEVAIKNIQQVENIYFADQAFRNMATGELVSWERITLDISENKIIKHFPAHLLKSSLVYGLTEVYTRVYEH